jgi:integrase
VRDHEWISKRDGRFSYIWAPDPALPAKHRHRTLPAHITSKVAAKAYVEAHREEMRAGESVRRITTPRVADLAPRWLVMREADERKAGSTVRDNVSHMKAHIVKQLGDLRVDELDRVNLRAFVRDLRGKVAPYTCRNVHTTLATFLDDIVSEGWAKLPFNPARTNDVRKELPDLRPLAGRSTILRLPDIGIAQELITNPVVPAERRVRYCVVLTTSLRDGEIAGLLVEDILFDRAPPVLTVKRALQLRVRGGNTALGGPKTVYSVRTLPLHCAASGALGWWLGHGRAFFCAGGPPRRGDMVFVSRFGKPWRPKSAAMLRTDLAAIGAPTQIDGHNLTFHALRRTCVTWLKAHGVPKDARDALLGHTPTDVAEKHYTDADMPLLAEYVGRLPLEWRDP